jgi:tetratricopeptide (TPR) repeat protein
MIKKIFVAFVVIIITNICFTAVKDLQNEIIDIKKNVNLNKADKITKMENFAKRAEQARYSKALLMIADFFLEVKEYEKAKKYYRKAAFSGLIKNNYFVIYACATRIAYLAGRDEGAMYLYQAAVRAMKKSDWYFTIRIAKAYAKMRRYKSASKWLERAGAMARLKKSINGLYWISKVYETMGMHYEHKVLFWYQAGRNLEKKLSGIR